MSMKKHIFKEKSLRSRSGQVAIILIIFLAVGLIAYAASLNFGKISDAKVSTMKAAETGAAMLGSLMASYGEQVFQEQLGGHEKICKFTLAFLSFLTFVALIILWVVAPSLGPLLGEMMAGALEAGALIGAIGAGVATGLQLVVVQPALTSAWNKMMNGMGDTNTFMEQGIQAALRAAVTDSVEVPDLFDTDNDGLFGDLAAPGDAKSAPDYVSRFGYFNTFRLARRGQTVTSAAVQNFKAALGDLAIADATDPGDWGFSDPGSCTTTTGSRQAICDECCLPQFMLSDQPETGSARHMMCKDGTVLNGQDGAPDIATITPTTAQINDAYSFCNSTITTTDPDGEVMTSSHGGIALLAPECCYVQSGANAGDDGSCGKPSTCAQRSPFYNGGNNFSANNYPFVLDLTAPENTSNSTISFREFLGVDDEHGFYAVNPTNPNWQDSINEAVTVKTGAHFSDAKEDYRSAKDFLITDASGFFLQPPFPSASTQYPVADRKQGIFPFFYKMRDWVVNLDEMTFDGKTAPTAGGIQCHWCDYTSPGSPYSAACGGTAGPLSSDAVYELANDITIDAETTYYNKLKLSTTGLLENNGGWCVDAKNLSGYPPVRPDKVPTITSLFADSSVCPLETDARWRAGADRYCSATFPYVEGCDRNGGYHQCTETEEIMKDGAVEQITLNRDCECGEPGAGANSLFNEDRIDEIVYGIPEFLVWAQTLVAQEDASLSANLDTWYEEAAEWIEEGCSVSSDPDNSACPRSYTKLARDGRLWRWKKTLELLYAKLNSWLVPEDGSASTAQSLSNNTPEAWCVPWADAGAPANEAKTFDSQSAAAAGTPGKDARGDLDDVIACLNWNARDTITWTGGEVTGNAEKFQACYDGCQQSIQNIGAEDWTISRDTLGRLSLCLGWKLPRTLLKDLNLVMRGKYTKEALNIALCRWSMEQPVPSFETCADSCGISTVQGHFGLPAYTGDGDCNTDSDFYKLLPAAYQSAVTDSCLNSQYMNYLQDSSELAKNQVEKFKKRADFLTARRAEAAAIRDEIKTAIDQLNAFLAGGAGYDSPAEQLIEERRSGERPGSLPSVAIYAWQDKYRDKPRPGTKDIYEGYAHAIKVEARLPRRCNDGCLTNTWPRVKTKSKMFKRCYYLSDTTGLVKVRVIRWDENRAADTVTFPNNMPLWRIRTDHPDSGPGGSFTAAAAICSQIAGEVLPPEFVGTEWPYARDWAGLGDLSGTGVQKKYFGKAFMLNRPPNNSQLNSTNVKAAKAEEKYKQCWEFVHSEMLRKGVVSEACAQYYFSGGSSGFGFKGFKLKFVACDEAFKRGDN